MAGDQTLLLTAFVAQDGPLGTLLYKAAEGYGQSCTFDRYAFVFPRCASLLEVHLPKRGKRVALDAYSVLAIKPHEPFEIVAVTGVSEWAILLPAPELVAKVAGLYKIDVAATLAAESDGGVLKRTNWLNEVMHRYVYERVQARQSDNEATAFLEAEILKEMHYRFKERHLITKSVYDLDEKALDRRGELVRRAMSFIEANLFRELTMAEVARACAASESSVLRAFRQALKQSPFGYIQGRRLDEAYLLLKAERYSASQVADVIGYENQSAFGKAFKKRFGLSPAEVHRNAGNET